MYFVLDPIEECERRAWEAYWERRKTKPLPFARHLRVRGGAGGGSIMTDTYLPKCAESSIGKPESSPERLDKGYYEY